MNTRALLLRHHLRDLHSLENQIHTTFPRYLKGVGDPDLAVAIADRFHAARSRKTRLKRMAAHLQVQLPGRECRWTAAFLQRGLDGLRGVGSRGRRDAAVVSACHQVTHYAMMAYRRARGHALELHEIGIAAELGAMLGELKGVDDPLSWIVNSRLTPSVLAG